MSAIAVGSVLHERYRVEELISVGGMGAVYAGTHLLLHKRVAIKVLRSDLPGGNLMLDRFHREAIAASGIGHENIVQVTDMGLVPDGTAYLVMELLEGSSLGAVIRSDAPLEIARACRIGCEILRGVGAAHGAGIVHRDLKPDNVFVARRGSREVIKILDFGVSLLKRQDLPHTRLTSTGTVVGTPRYMSPEQARGEQNLSEAVDIYASAVVLYEMLTGHLPYDGTNYNVVIHEIMSGELVPIEKRRADVPAGLSHVIRRALALSPADRFADAEEMARALEPWIDAAVASHSASRSAPAARAERLVEALAVTESATPSAARSKRFVPARNVTADPAWAVAKGESATVAYGVSLPAKRRSAALVIALLLLAAAGAAAGVYAFWFRGGDDPPPAAATRAQPARPAAPARSTAAIDASPAADEVRIDLVIVPSTATVMHDGVPISGRTLVLPRGSTPVEIRIEAPDHVARTHKLIPDRDRELSLELMPKAGGRGPARPKLSAEPEPDPNEPTPSDEPPLDSADASPE